MVVTLELFLVHMFDLDIVSVLFPVDRYNRVLVSSMEILLVTNLVGKVCTVIMLVFLQDI
jgi:hypothetical protein